MLTDEEDKSLRMIRLCIAPAKWFRIDKASLPQWLDRNADGTRMIDLIHRLVDKGRLRQEGVRIYPDRNSVAMKPHCWSHISLPIPPSGNDGKEGA